MKILPGGVGILSFVLFLFYLKSRVESPLISRLTHSEVMMQFVVIPVVMIAVGIVIIIADLLS